MSLLHQYGLHLVNIITRRIVFIQHHVVVNVPNFMNKSTIGGRGRGRIKGEDPKSKLTSYESIVEDLEHLHWHIAQHVLDGKYY